MSVLSQYAKKRDAIRASRIKRTAKLCGVSPSLVYKVLDMDRENELVVTVFMTLAEKEKELENHMVELVKELVLFDQEYKSATQQKPGSCANADTQKKIA